MAISGIDIGGPVPDITSGQYATLNIRVKPPVILNKHITHTTYTGIQPGQH